MDQHPERHFDGLLAQLSIYARSLHPGEVEALYQDVLQHRSVHEGIGNGGGGGSSGASAGQEDGPDVSDDELSGTAPSAETKICQPLLPVGTKGACNASEICIPGIIMQDATAPDIIGDDNSIGTSSSEAASAAASGQCLEVPRGLEPLLQSSSFDDDEESRSSDPPLPGIISNSAFPVPAAWFALGGDKAFEAWPPEMPSLKQAGGQPNDR